MKKSLVIAIVALMGAVLALQYNTRADRKNAAGVPRPDVEPGGISLPADAGDLAPVSTTGYADAWSAAIDDRKAAAEEAACPEGAIDLILQNRGVTWGRGDDPGAKPVTVSPETDKLADAVNDYLICRAATEWNLGFCDRVSETGKISSQVCHAELDMALVLAYMAGRHGNHATCRASFEKARKAGLLGGEAIDSDKFCAVAAGGMGNICVNLAMERKKCLRIFPAQKNDCGSDQACAEDYLMYAAIKKGNPGECPADQRHFCKAVLSDKAECSKVALSASRIYCSAFTGKNRQLPFNEKAAQEEILREVNKKVREQMKTLGAPEKE